VGWVEELATRYGGTVAARWIVAEAMIAGVGAIHVECPRALRPDVHALIEHAPAADDRIRTSGSSPVATVALLEAVQARLARREPRLSIVVEPRVDTLGESVAWRVEEASIA
jgi:hypothetical protein